MKLSFAYLEILLYFCHPHREEVLRWPTASSAIGRKIVIRLLKREGHPNFRHASVEIQNQLRIAAFCGSVSYCTNSRFPNRPQR